DQAAAARLECLALALDQTHDGGADRAEPGKTDFQRRDHGPSREQSGASAPRRQGNDVVQPFKAGFKKTADGARGPADALLVRDKRDAYEAFPMLAERDAGRDGKLRLLDQQRGEFEASERLERRRDRRPGEHRGAWRRDRPTGPTEGFHENVAPA